MGVKWLVTGGCGFLGSSLVRLLATQPGNSIRVVDNLSVGSLEDLGRAAPFIECDDVPASWPESGVQFVRADILDEALSLRVVAGADVVVHLAANTGVGPSVEAPRMDCVTNVIGTFNYLEAARQNGVKRFVFASSGAPIGECEPPIHEELAPHPVSPYGASKLAGEGYCSAYFRTFGLETVALRFGNVYGPGSGHKNSVVAKFIKQAMQGETLEIYGDGMQTRDFVYIDDLLRAIVSAATSRAAVGGQTFQIATSAETTVRGLFEAMSEAFRERGMAVPAVRYSESRVGDVRRNFSDTSKAARILGWRAEVGLVDGIRQTLAWFTARGAQMR